jgi:hypothetical protein
MCEQDGEGQGGGCPETEALRSHWVVEPAEPRAL